MTIVNAVITALLYLYCYVMDEKLSCCSVYTAEQELVKACCYVRQRDSGPAGWYLKVNNRWAATSSKRTSCQIPS